MPKSLILTCAALLATIPFLAMAQSAHRDGGGETGSTTVPPYYMSTPGAPPYSGRSSSTTSNRDASGRTIGPSRPPSSGEEQRALQRQIMNE
jgi:hypothetical protein